MSGTLPLLDPSNLRTSLEDDVPGLRASYFANASLAGAPTLERTDRQIDFSWGWASPGGDLPKSEYSVRWEGFFVPSTDGLHRLAVSATDGGYRLYVDGVLQCDEWIDLEKATFEDRYTTRSSVVELGCETGRPRALRLEYAKTGNKAGIRLEAELPDSPDGIEIAAEAAGRSDYAIIFAGISNRFEGGNNDRSDMSLPGDQNRLVRAVAAANPKTVVVLVNGSPIDVREWVDAVPTIVEAWYPGQEGGNALAAILFGDVNPSGKLPQTIPVRLEDNPSFGNFPGEDGVVSYEEGVFVGYRHYDTKGIKPAFPFGFGLSYTRFTYRDLSIRRAQESGERGSGTAIEVSVKVRNAGARNGSEVVQLYVHDIDSSQPRPTKELKAFSKVNLDPGEERDVSFTLTPDSFAFFDADEGRFVVEPGLFQILIGGNPGALLSASVEYDGETGFGHG